MQTILNATDVRANFGGFIDTIVREKPQAIKRNRDIIMAFSKQHMKELLSIYTLTFEYEQDEDGRYAGSIEQIEDIVADGGSIDELRRELARQLLEYAIDYENNYSRYYNTPNRHNHAPYVLRVLLEDDLEAVARMFHDASERKRQDL
jgi:predicted RNase H-like HicB family nuclease